MIRSKLHIPRGKDIIYRRNGILQKENQININ